MKTSISAKPISTLSFFSAITKNNSSNAPRFLCQISKFTTFSPINVGASASYPSRRNEEVSHNVRVSVWWDFENCHLPTAVNVFRVAQCITAAVRTNGIRGPIQITAFGDVSQLSRLNQEALSATGISLAHIPRGGKNSADRSLLVDLMYWVSQNPPPAHLFLISGDRDFAGVLHRLRMNNYNILLASIDSAPSVLCSAASIMWNWNSLLKGENISGKHFNQPPDGPYGSWYGSYRAPIDDPFAAADQPVCPRVEESSPESGLDPKARPIPRFVVMKIRHILYSYPKGIPITELRAELSRSNINIDKDFYGYKKFSRFLLAMPQILKLQSANDGQFLVHSVPQKFSERNGELDSVLTPKLNGEKSSSSEHVGKSTRLVSSDTPMRNEGELHFPSAEIQKASQELQVPPSPGPKVNSSSAKSQKPTTNMQEQPREVQEPPACLQVVNNAKVTENQADRVQRSGPASELGFFKRIWSKWFRYRDSGLEEKTSSKGQEISPEEKKTEEKNVKSMIHSSESVDQTPFSPSSGEERTDGNTSDLSAAGSDKTGKPSGFLSQILSRFKFWRSSMDSDPSSEDLEKKTNQMELGSHVNEEFAKETFWDELVAFIDTPEAAALIMQSTDRMQMVQNLQKQGPAILSSLSEDDLHHLVNLMISDKKWIEESPSEGAPFKLIRTDEKVPFSKLSNSRSSNGLSFIFSNTDQPSLSEELQEHDGHIKVQNAPNARLSQPVIEGKPPGKSKNEILADCQKLIDEILERYPEGFNMGSFKKMFLEKYGYSLAVRKLGYQKLATFLQTLPGVRIESTYIVPSLKVQKSPGPETAERFVEESKLSATEANSESELPDASWRDDDLDSPWEELGPVANSGPKKSERGSVLRGETIDEPREKICHDYESLSDDNFSDSEDETLSSMNSRSIKKHRVNNEESSLLQILDSWHNSKEYNNKKDSSEHLDGVVDSSGNGLKDSCSAGSTFEDEIHTVKKQTPFKSYSFVADQPVDSKEKLIDGILGSLKKAGERSSESRM